MSILVVRYLVCDTCGYKAEGTAANPLAAGLVRTRKGHECLPCGQKRMADSAPKCPSEPAYRRHLKRGEQCRACRNFVNRLEHQRRARHPEWSVRR